MPMIVPAPTWLKALEAAGQASEGFVIARDRERVMQQREEALDLDRDAFEADQAQAERAFQLDEEAAKEQKRQFDVTEARYGQQADAASRRDFMSRNVPRSDKTQRAMLGGASDLMAKLGPLYQPVSRALDIASRFENKEYAKQYASQKVVEAQQQKFQEQMQLDVQAGLWGPDDQQGLQMFATRMAMGEEMDQLARDYQVERSKKIDNTAKAASLQAEVAEAEAFLGQMKAMVVGSAKATLELNRIAALFNAGDLKPSEAKIAAIKATSGNLEDEEEEDPDEAILNQAYKAMPDDPEGARELAESWSADRRRLLLTKAKRKGGQALAAQAAELGMSEQEVMQTLGIQAPAPAAAPKQTDEERRAAAEGKVAKAGAASMFAPQIATAIGAGKELNVENDEKLKKIRSQIESERKSIRLKKGGPQQSQVKAHQKRMAELMLEEEKLVRKMRGK